MHTRTHTHSGAVCKLLKAKLLCAIIVLDKSVASCNNAVVPTEETPMANGSSNTTAKMCTCGREIRSFPHCPACGSFNVYAKNSNAIKLLVPDTGQGTGHPAEYLTARGFKCRRCSLEYHEAEACEAPRFESKSMAERRRVDAASTKVTAALQGTGGSREELLKQMFGKKEAKP